MCVANGRPPISLQPDAHCNCNQSWMNYRPHYLESFSADIFRHFKSNWTIRITKKFKFSVVTIRQDKQERV